MELFPYTLIRVGGAPHDEFAKLSLNQVPKLFDALQEKREQVQSSTLTLCDYLFERVSQLDDDQARKKLLNIKRDIFNGRSVSDGKFDFLRTHSDTKGIELIDRHRQLMSERDELLAECASTFEADMKAARGQMRELAASETLRKGLVLSSRSLLNAADTYIKRGERKPNKQMVKAELSLIKYMARIYGKTSPFSTFTNLGAIKVVESDEQAPFPELDGAHRVVGEIRLNNYLYDYLYALFRSHPAYVNHLFVRPNPTLNREGENYLYLTNNKNVESFQRVPLQPVLELFEELSGSRPEGVPFGELAIQAAEAVDASDEELRSYIDQLLQIGFLEYSTGVSGIDPDWDKGLTKLLESWPKDLPFRDGILQVLAKLREGAEQYADAVSDQRIVLLQDAYDQFRSVCLALHEDAGLPEEERYTEEERRVKAQVVANTEDQGEEKQDEDKQEEGEVFKHVNQTVFNFKPEQMYYEDTILDGNLTISSRGLGDLAELFNDLINGLPLFSSEYTGKASFKHFLKDKQTPMSLLGFYESYYREYKKPLAELDEKRKEHLREGKEGDPPSRDSFEIPGQQEVQERRNKWAQDLVARLDCTGETVNITRDDLAAINEAHDIPPGKTSTASFGAFVQPYLDENNQVSAALNGICPGNGRMFSRFLHLFEDGMTETLRADNQTMHPDAWLLEDCDASIFNANIHPPLMPYEVWMPGGQNSLPAEQQVPITDILIDMDGDEPYLRHARDGRPILVYDLGFQGSMGRSELFNLMGGFNTNRFVTYGALLEGINKLAIESRGTEGALFKPRVTFENRIILQRKQWVIRVKDLPQTGSGGAWERYHSFAQWQRDLKLPHEVFIKIFRRETQDQIAAEKAKKLGRDDYKPQYIDFRNPFLVRLLDKLCERVPEALTVSEMMPGTRHFWRSEDRPYVTEYVMQWKVP